MTLHVGTPINELQKENQRLRRACKAAYTELIYLAEQVKAREGGSVRRAIEQLEMWAGPFNEIFQSPATGAGTLDRRIPKFNKRKFERQCERGVQKVLAMIEERRRRNEVQQ